MRRRMVVAKTQKDQQQQQRIVHWQTNRPRAYASCGEEYHSPGEKNAQTNPDAGSPSGCEGPGWTGVAAANSLEGDETPGCEEGGDSPHVTQKTTASHPPDPWRGIRL